MLLSLGRVCLLFFVLAVSGPLLAQSHRLAFLSHSEPVALHNARTSHPAVIVGNFDFTAEGVTTAKTAPDDTLFWQGVRVAHFNGVTAMDASESFAAGNVPVAESVRALETVENILAKFAVKPIESPRGTDPLVYPFFRSLDVAQLWALKQGNLSIRDLRSEQQELLKNSAAYHHVNGPLFQIREAKGIVQRINDVSVTCRMASNGHVFFGLQVTSSNGRQRFLPLVDTAAFLAARPPLRNDFGNPGSPASDYRTTIGAVVHRITSQTDCRVTVDASIAELPLFLQGDSCASPDDTLQAIARVWSLRLAGEAGNFRLSRRKITVPSDRGGLHGVVAASCPFALRSCFASPSQWLALKQRLLGRLFAEYRAKGQDAGFLRFNELSVDSRNGIAAYLTGEAFGAIVQQYISTPVFEAGDFGETMLSGSLHELNGKMCYLVQFFRYDPNGKRRRVIGFDGVVQ